MSGKRYAPHPSETDETKYCPACDTTKELDQFYNCPGGRKDRATYCKLCAKERSILRAKERYETDSEFRQKRVAEVKKYSKSEKGLVMWRKFRKKRNKDPKWLAKEAERRNRPEQTERRRRRRWERYHLEGGAEKDRLRHEEAYKTGHWRARRAVATAERQGLLKKTVCAQKSEECRGKLEWHHHKGYEPENYLEVVCLCTRHHKLADAALKKAEPSTLN